MAIYLRIHKKTGWDVDIVDVDDPRNYASKEQILSSHDDCAADWDLETSFGPFPSLEAAETAFNRWDSENNPLDADVWSEEAYSDLYVEVTNG